MPKANFLKLQTGRESDPSPDPLMAGLKLLLEHKMNWQADLSQYLAKMTIDAQDNRQNPKKCQS